MKIAAPGIRTGNHDGEGIVEAERRQPLYPPPLLVFGPYFDQNMRCIRRWRQLEDRGQSCPGVLRIHIDFTVDQGLVCEQCAAKIQLALDLLPQPAFKLLGHDFSQHKLLAEILRSDDDRPRARASAKRREDQAGDNFCSSHPNPSSATSAISAAGIAPARICAVSD